ncbi:hypothetical protein [Actinomadura miaoliensis]
MGTDHGFPWPGPVPRPAAPPDHLHPKQRHRLIVRLGSTRLLT